MAVTVFLRRCHNKIITYDHRSRNAFTCLQGMIVLFS